ncbi:hypothetical protein [Candidatus Mycoplasma haematominutum]|uniref:Uncharacterized protein n=1 Tax=Candidatus Mycoplasma haematominutum 'Birmingham 1' TaxID=1116213 RepID=G8C3C3_9MOLU|nr:hypothetical protein [Candidatus Mycoplasma haematominutum]CCE66821.1 hypothetical protein MHM_03030 [Candidatus Mycoplasma haematominutum 'Birmingham 1']
MPVSFAKVAVLGLGGATTASGAYLFLKPESTEVDTRFATFYDSMRDSIISEEDREELQQMGIEVEKYIRERNSRFSSAALWLLEKDNHKTLFSDIAKVVGKKEGWEATVGSLGNRLQELVREVKKDKEESTRVEFSEDKLVAKALKADLKNITSNLESLRESCRPDKKIDCNLENLYLPVAELLKSWENDDEEVLPKSTEITALTPKSSAK